MTPEYRSRMISFRLSAEEYERFRELCFSLGIRNLSEMARAAINMLLDNAPRAAESSLAARVSELEGKLNLLSLELKRTKSS